MKTESKRIVQALIVIMLAIVMIVQIRYENNKEFNDEYINAKTNTTGTKISVYMGSDNKLKYTVEKMNIQCDNKEYIEINNFDWLKSDIDTDCTEYSIKNKKYSIDKDTELKTISINKDFAYVEYANKQNNANKEVLICRSKPSDIDTSGFERINFRFFENTTSIADKTYKNSFNDSFLMINESLGGGSLNNKTLRDVSDSIENDAKVSKKTENINIEFAGLQSLDVSSISEFEDNTQIKYNRDDDVLRISNENNEELLIFDVYNEAVGCRAEDLLKTSIDDRVFINKGFDDEESNGYNTFAILADNNIYGFKTSNREMVYEVLKSLGVTPKQLLVDTVQSVIEKGK